MFLLGCTLHTTFVGAKLLVLIFKLSILIFKLCALSLKRQSFSLAASGLCLQGGDSGLEIRIIALQSCFSCDCVEPMTTEILFLLVIIIKALSCDCHSLL